MAKYGKNNYFDGVVLPEPKEEALRRMAKGVKLGYNQVSTASDAIKMVSPGIPIETNDVSIEFFGNSFGSNNYDRPFIFNNDRATLFQAYAEKIGQNGVLNAFYNSSVDKPRIGYSALTPNERFHFVWTREDTTLRAYINGNLMGSIENIPIADFGEFHLGIMNSSDVGFARVWDYALSAAEVAALYNNGNPAGYVLPTIRKYGGPFNISGLTSYTWTGETDRVYYRELLLGRFIQTGAVVMIKGSVSDYQSGEPFVYVGNRQAMIPAQNGSFTLKVINNRDNIDRIYYYGGTHLGDRRLTITIDSVALVGCVAEYLPQNLIPTAEGSVVQWLDSAPQLPEANGTFPPLDASVGGYDLAAIGNPKIII